MAIGSGERKSKQGRTPERLRFRSMAQTKRVKPADDSAKQEARRERLRARGLRIAEIRAARGYSSQLSFATKSGAIDSGSLNTVERGEKDINASTAEDVADALRVSVDVLLGRAPFDPLDDAYPARAGLLASREFVSAPDAVRERVKATKPVDDWSAVRWVRYFITLSDLFAATGALPSPDDGPRIKPQR